MSGWIAMWRPGWWPVRKSRKLAEQAEAARDKTHREVTVPLRKLRRDDFMTPAVVDEIRRQQHRQG